MWEQRACMCVGGIANHTSLAVGVDGGSDACMLTCTAASPAGMHTLQCWRSAHPGSPVPYDKFSALLAGDARFRLRHEVLDAARNAMRALVLLDAGSIAADVARRGAGPAAAAAAHMRTKPQHAATPALVAVAPSAGASQVGGAAERRGPVSMRCRHGCRLGGWLNCLDTSIIFQASSQQCWGAQTTHRFACWLRWQGEVAAFWRAQHMRHTLPPHNAPVLLAWPHTPPLEASPVHALCVTARRRTGMYCMRWRRCPDLSWAVQWMPCCRQHRACATSYSALWPSKC